MKSFHDNENRFLNASVTPTKRYARRVGVIIKKRRDELLSLLGKKRTFMDFLNLNLNPKYKKIYRTFFSFKNGSVIKTRIISILERCFVKGYKPPELEHEPFPLEFTRNCIFQGITLFKCGSAPQRFLPQIPLFLRVLERAVEKGIVSRKVQEKFRDFVAICGCFDSNSHALKEMGDDVLIEFDKECLIKASIDASKRLFLPKIDQTPSIKWLSHVSINPKARSGFLTELIFKGKKNKTFHFAHAVSKRIWRQIRREKEPFPDLSLWSMGGRARKDHSHEDGIARSRIVLMPDFPSAIIGQAIAEPITAGIQELQEKDPKNIQNFMGFDPLDGRWKLIHDWAEPNDFVIEIDWTRFDTTVQREILIHAFGLMRLCYPANSFLDRLFLWLASGAILKNVIIPGGYVFKICKGIASGTPFTSLLGGICNCIGLCYMMRKSSVFEGFKPEEIKLAFAGDDTLINFGKKLPNLIDFKERMINESFTLLGQKLKDEKIKGGFWLSYSDEDEALSFLKMIFIHGLPSRSIQALCETIGRPEKPMPTIHRYSDHLRSASEIPLYGLRANNLLIETINEAESYVNVGPYVLEKHRTPASSRLRMAKISVMEQTFSRERLPWHEKPKPSWERKIRKKYGYKPYNPTYIYDIFPSGMFGGFDFVRFE